MVHCRQCNSACSPCPGAIQCHCMAPGLGEQTGYVGWYAYLHMVIEIRQGEGMRHVYTILLLIITQKLVHNICYQLPRNDIALLHFSVQIIFTIIKCDMLLCTSIIPENSKKEHLLMKYTFCSDFCIVHTANNFTNLFAKKSTIFNLRNAVYFTLSCCFLLELTGALCCEFCLVSCSVKHESSQ